MAASRFIAVFSPQRGPLLEIAHRLSPRVELYPPNGIILEVPVRCEQEVINGLAPWITEGTAIGGASSRAAAILAAATCSGTFVPYGREKSFVAGLPVASLAVWPETDPALLKTLEHWGIRTLGELSDLSENALAARLGQRGVRLRRFIRGEEDPPSEPHQPECRFQVSRELDWTVYLLEPLTFVLGSMLEELCTELRGQGLAVETLRLSLRLEQGGVFEHNFRPAIPIQDAKNLLSLLRLELQSHCPQAGIQAITLQAEPARARIFQHSLLQPGAMHPEKLARTLSRLQALVGEDRVGSPQLVDTHRPDAVRLGEFRGAPLFTALPEAPPNREPRLTLRRLRPPQTIELCGEEILACAGPWRSSGDWWLEGGVSDGWSRDEWDIELTSGGIYRVFWDHIRRRWFLEGVYD